MPPELVILAWISLVLGVACMLAIVWDIVICERYQKMAIMNLVWPITALWSGPLGLLAYWAFGRAPPEDATDRNEDMREPPQWLAAGKAATHCGSGCTLGDLCAEWLVFAAPSVLIAFGYRSIFQDKIFATWVLDFIFAFVLGILFQYLTIVPMRHLPFGKGVLAALRADALSLTAWQIGMYGWMAVVTFLIFGRELDQTDPVFWFMMQIAMGAGFLVSYPVNWWLVKMGWKEKM